MDDRQYVIEQKHELLVRETFSRPTLNRCADMSDEMKDRYIEYLADEVHQSNLEKEAMRLVLEDFLKRQQELDKELFGLKKYQADTKAELDKETQAREKAERNAADLVAKFKYANKNRFGFKRQAVKKEEGKDAEHPSDLSKVPGCVLDRKMVKVSRFGMSLIEEHFEMIQYVKCGSKPKCGYFLQEGHPQVVSRFEGGQSYT